MIGNIEKLLGSEAKSLLGHKCTTFKKEDLHLPGPDFVDRIFANSDRPINVLKSLQQILNTGRLAGTGFVSILPVDQGIEHSAGASFAPNPIYFDPENIVKLAIEGGCNAVASTLGVLGMVAWRPPTSFTIWTISSVLESSVKCCLCKMKLLTRLRLRSLIHYYPLIKHRNKSESLCNIQEITVKKHKCVGSLRREKLEKRIVPEKGKNLPVSEILSDIVA